MSDEDEESLRDQLVALQQEHRDLDSAIAALDASGSADNLQIKRLKKRKLFLKDRMSHIEDRLTPDIIA
ncbi:YdcH family protein [Microbaculum sp. FT89]|uniref:YdcH family protein n=1 Tax=Microbaculum sp. FT89 TaxID=3447298 RepID=UPI003F532B07